MKTTGESDYTAGADNTFVYNAATGYVTMYVDSFSPFTAVYDAPVASVGASIFYSLDDAIKTAKTSGNPVVLPKDATKAGNDGFTIGANEILTFDLNGWTLTNAVNENKASQVFKNNGTLTIKDSRGGGVLTNAVEGGTQPGEWWPNQQYNYASNVITNAGTLNIESGTIRQTTGSSICYCVDNNSSGADAVFNMKGGKLEAPPNCCSFVLQQHSEEEQRQCFRRYVRWRGFQLWCELHDYRRYLQR